MMDRIMNPEQIRLLHERNMKQEQENVLNMLYRTARVSTLAAEERINARTDLNEEQKEKLIKAEHDLLSIAKRYPKIGLPRPLPDDRANLIAFNNFLSETIQKYQVVERNGVFHVL